MVTTLVTVFYMQTCKVMGIYLTEIMVLPGSQNASCFEYLKHIGKIHTFHHNINSE